MAFGANFGRHFGLSRVGIHHERLPPGTRLSRPHAESMEEEFVYVIAGEPDVWLDGELHRLSPGDAVGFPPGDGLAHTFINNTDHDVHLIVVGEASRADNKIHYPLNPEMRELRKDWWHDVPERKIGDHNGHPDSGASNTDT